MYPVVSGELTPPFYADNDLFVDLERQASVIPPYLQESYADLERSVSQAFVALYGHYMNPEQREYFANRRVLFTDPESAKVFGKDGEDEKNWDTGIHTLTIDAALDNSVIHTGYAIGNTAVENDPYSADRMPIRHFLAGRITVYPLLDKEICDVGPKWFMTEQAFRELAYEMETYAEEDVARTCFFWSNEIGSKIVHEKVHGIQDDRLPLAILEAAAYYYERKIFLSNAWHYTEPEDNTGLLAVWYEDCVREFGEDIHRFIFGNLESGRRRELLGALKDRLRLDYLKALSRDGADKNQHIHWY